MVKFIRSHRTSFGETYMTEDGFFFSCEMGNWYEISRKDGTKYPRREFKELQDARHLYLEKVEQKRNIETMLQLLGAEERW